MSDHVEDSSRAPVDRPARSEVVAQFLNSLACPVGWYGCALVALWIGFMRDLKGTPEANQIGIWRGYGVSVGEFVVVAAALWAVHIVTLAVRPSTWQSVAHDWRAIASALAGVITFAWTAALIAVANATSASYEAPLVAFAVVAAAGNIAATLAATRLVPRLR